MESAQLHSFARRDFVGLYVQAVEHGAGTDGAALLGVFREEPKQLGPARVAPRLTSGARGGGPTPIAQLLPRPPRGGNA